MFHSTWSRSEVKMSYLKGVKSHFEGNKRSKEYTAHQSKVRMSRVESVDSCIKRGIATVSN